MGVTKTAVQRALNDLWYKHYIRPITQDERNQLVADFIEKRLSQWMKDEIYNPVFRHPMTRLKQRHDLPRVTIAEILADFVLRADMHEERQAEYPVTHDEQDLTLEDRRRNEEVGLFSDDIDAEAGERVPYGYVTEAQAVAEQYTPKDPPSVEEFRAELARAKKYASFYAASISEEHGYDESDTLRRIKGLKLDRVKECRVCGGGFYARDMRRENCDQQHGIKSVGDRSKMSACELIYQSVYQSEYYQKMARNA